MSAMFKSEIESVKPEWAGAAPRRVKAFFTCRTGGVSSGPWGGPDGIMGMNLAAHTGDAKFCVDMNRRILAQCLPGEPKWLAQVHGTEILHADDVRTDLEAPEADGAWTATPGIVCSVMTADCLPVLLADRSGRIVAALHAGWRSLADGILQKGVAKLLAEAPGADLAAWLGPRIGPEAFEVGPDVLEAMRRHLHDADRHFRPAGEGRWLADLAGLAHDALVSSGVAPDAITNCGLSTYGDAQRFFSFRRDGERSGRHAALIWIEPVEAAQPPAR